MIVRKAVKAAKSFFSSSPINGQNGILLHFIYLSTNPYEMKMIG
jgi:hypothetical protein